MAVYPIAPGLLQDMSSTSSNGVTPIKWVPGFIEKWNDVNMFEEICDTDIDVQEGDTFVMSTIPNVPIQRDYKAGQKLVISALTSPAVKLLINHSAAFSPVIDDIQERQMAKNKDWRGKLMGQAAVDVKNDIDEVVLQTIYSDAAAANCGITAGAKSQAYNVGAAGTPLALTPSNILQFLTAMNSIMGEANAPMDSRFAIIPEWLNNLIFNSDIKSASMMGEKNGSILKGNGRIPYKICNLDLYVDEHLSTTSDSGHTCWRVLFGAKGSVLFASQLKKLEDARPYDTFETVLKGLEVYGFKTKKSEGLGMAFVYPGAWS